MPAIPLRANSKSTESKGKIASLLSFLSKPMGAHLCPIVCFFIMAKLYMDHLIACLKKRTSVMGVSTFVSLRQNGYEIILRTPKGPACYYVAREGEGVFPADDEADVIPAADVANVVYRARG